MKNPVLIFCVFCISSIINAQNINLEWAKSFGGAGNDAGNCITTDNLNNNYTTGYFSGTVDFDPSTAIYNLTSNGAADFFIQKLDASGNFVWAISMGGDASTGYKIKVDDNGNIYVVGIYKGTVDFDPGPNVFNLTAAGNITFILKLDASGNFVWVKSITIHSTSYTFDIDDFGNFYFASTFGGTVDFDLDGTTYTMTSTGGTGDGFILKLKADGSFNWVKHIDGTSSIYANEIRVDSSNNIYLVGSFGETVDFDPSAGVTNRTSNGHLDIYILKLNSIGEKIWVKTIGGLGPDECKAVSLDHLNNLNITGNFQETVDFDPSNGVYNLISNGISDCFVLQLNEDGNFNWAKSIGGGINDWGTSIVTNASGTLFITGIFMGTVDFDPSASVYTQITSGIVDAFLLILNNNGDFLIAQSFGGTSITYSSTIALDNYENIYLSGYYAESVNFDANSTNVNLISNGANDIFILKLGSIADIIENNFTFNVFPNPTLDVINVQLIENNIPVTLEISNSLGEVINVIETVELETTVGFPNNGIYFIKVIQGDNSKIKKVVKQ